MQQRVGQDIGAHSPQDPLAELARLIGGQDPWSGLMPDERRDTINQIIERDGPPSSEIQWKLLGQSVCQLRPHQVLDAIFHVGSILAGKEHIFALPDTEWNGLIHSARNPVQEAFFYRDIHVFRIAEN